MPRTTINIAEVAVYSFKKATPLPIAHYEINLDNLRDPMGQPSMKNLNGLAPTVQAFIRLDPRFSPILDQCIQLVSDKCSQGPGEKWITIGFRDYHGRWKSVAMAELIGEALSTLGYKVGVQHAGL